jgi:hypothetical protein
LIARVIVQDQLPELWPLPMDIELLQALEKEFKDGVNEPTALMVPFKVLVDLSIELNVR